MGLQGIDSMFASLDSLASGNFMDLAQRNGGDSKKKGKGQGEDFLSSLISHTLGIGNNDPISKPALVDKVQTSESGDATVGLPKVGQGGADSTGTVPVSTKDVPGSDGVDKVLNGAESAADGSAPKVGAGEGGIGGEGGKSGGGGGGMDLGKILKLAMTLFGG